MIDAETLWLSNSSFLTFPALVAVSVRQIVAVFAVVVCAAAKSASVG
ncbi:hypothetical protein AwEntero_01850 [Enterobacterales bacterium]|nr:hypothetical protein AwEntero_01850 [Enterobacterales bacterium]